MHDLKYLMTSLESGKMPLESFDSFEDVVVMRDLSLADVTFERHYAKSFSPSWNASKTSSKIRNSSARFLAFASI